MLQRTASTRIGVALPASLVLAAASLAPAPQGDEPIATPLVQREEVRFVTLDLVVEEKRAGKWRNAEALRREQVTVRLDGKPIELDSFENRCHPSAEGQPPARRDDLPATPEERDEPATRPEDAMQPAAPPQEDVVRYVLYFDVTHMKVEGFHMSIKAALEWAETARPDDEVMIVVGGRSLRIFRPLWPAHDRLREDILAVRDSGALADSWANDEGDGKRGRIGEILLLPNIYAMRALADTYAAEDFFYTRHSLENLEALMTLFDSIEGAKNLILFQETIRQYPGEVYPAVDSLTDVTPFLQDLAAAANERSVRVYPVHASGLPAGRGRGWNDALSLLASETGGQYVHGTNRIATVIERAEEDSACSYRVGFRVRPRFSGGTQRIDVQVDGGRYRVRHRRTLHDPTRAELDRDQLKAAFLDPGAATAFPVHAAVATLSGGAATARTRFEIRVARSDLLDLAGGADGGESRQIQAQIGGTVVPVLPDPSDPAPVRPGPWIDADPGKETWSFARQSTLRLSADPGPQRDLVLVEEAALPVGAYRLVAVVQDQLARAVAAHTVDFTIAPASGPLGDVRLAYLDPAIIPIPPGAGENAPASGNRKLDEKPHALSSSLPPGAVLAVDATVAGGETTWLLYSLCDPQDRKDEPQFADWALERTLVCRGRPQSPLATSIAQRPATADCMVVVDPLPASLPPGPCAAEVTLHRPGAPSETRHLEFTVEPPRRPDSPSTTTPP